MYTKYGPLANYEKHQTQSLCRQYVPMCFPIRTINRSWTVVIAIACLKSEIVENKKKKNRR